MLFLLFLGLLIWDFCKQRREERAEAFASFANRFEVMQPGTVGKVGGSIPISLTRQYLDPDYDPGPRERRLYYGERVEFGEWTMLYYSEGSTQPLIHQSGSAPDAFNCPDSLYFQTFDRYGKPIDLLRLYGFPFFCEGCCQELYFQAGELVLIDGFEQDTVLQRWAITAEGRFEAFLRDESEQKMGH